MGKPQLNQSGNTQIAVLFKNNIRQYAMLIALVVILGLFGILTNGVILIPQNVANLVMQNGYVIILGIGMMLCILTGGNIDLSVGSIVAIIGALAGQLIIAMKLPSWLGLLACIAGGFAIGAWQGFCIAIVRIPPFIATLAGALLFRGLTNAVMQGQTLAPFPQDFLVLTAGFIKDIIPIAGPKINITSIVGGVIVAAVYIIFQIRKRVNKRKYNFEDLPFHLFIIKLIVISAITIFFFYWLALYKGMPTVLIILAILIIGYTFFTTKTVPGRYLYAMGGNEKAARLSGINTRKVLFFAYMNMAVLAAVAGIVFSARSNSASPLAGKDFELDAIAACFIGGASASGGVGTIVGAVVGAFVMGILNNGMSLLGVGVEWQMVIKGLVLVAAVAFDVYSKSRSKA
jgi:putative multiple sugar transport system permease protein